MGVTQIAKGVLAEAEFNPTGPFLPFDAPVRDGLIAWHFFGVSKEKSLFNFAPGGIQGCSVIGSPTYDEDFITLKSRGNASPAYLETPYSETSSMTIISVCRFTGANDATATRGVLVSTQSSPAANDEAVTLTAPLQIAPNNTNAIFATVMRGASAAAAAQNGASLTANVLANWKAISMDVPSNGTNVIRDHTAGTSGTAASNTGTHQRSSSKLRIGSSYTTSNGGTIDILGLAIYNRVLTSDERDEVVAAFIANADAKGITV